MFPSLDIFKIDSGGNVLWRGAVESVEAARKRIQKLALSSPGEYLILDQNTGSRVHVTPLTQVAQAEDLGSAAVQAA
jgi:hypothetical protein